MKYHHHILLFSWLMLFPFVASAQGNNQPNILFIAVDDLKPNLGCYGDKVAITPNIDALAEQGTVFTNSHCQQAVCGPSRASLMTGFRPDQTQVWDLKTLIRDKRPEIVTIPQYFKSQGYVTMGVGKIFDPRSVDKEQDKVSWSEYILPQNLTYAKGYDKPLYYYQNPDNRKRIKELQAEAKAKGLKGYKATKYVQKQFKPAYEKANVPDDAYIDGAINNGGISLLKKAAKADKPFFLAVGYKRPHLPFVAPTKYWDLYKGRNIPLAQFKQKVKGGVNVAYHNSGELKGYVTPDLEIKDVNGVVDIAYDKQKTLIHGYYAATSYVDALVGQLLATLKEQKLDKNTIIILWGDHGWHLGDHKLWNKHSNFEQATRAPMIIVDPRKKGVRSVASPTEFVDIFPTLVDLAGLKQVNGLAGTSVKPLMTGKKKSVKEYAISQIPRGKRIGYSLRTERYRYTSWYKGNVREAASLDINNRIAEEIYDYEADPLEKRNLAKDKKYAKILEELRAKFKNHFDTERSYPTM